MSILAAIFARLGLAGSIAVALVLALGVQTFRLHLADGKIDKIEAADKAAADHARVIEANAAKISDTARNTLDQRQAQIITRYKTLVQRTTQYVTAKDDARCSVPAGFVSVFNAASRDAELPRPASGSEGSPSGVPLSAVLSVTVEDFGVAYDWRAEALGWRDWYVKQKAAWDSK